MISSEISRNQTSPISKNCALSTPIFLTKSEKLNIRIIKQSYYSNTMNVNLNPDIYYEIRIKLNDKDFYSFLMACKAFSVYKYREKRDRIKKRMKKWVLKHGFRKRNLKILEPYIWLKSPNMPYQGKCIYNNKNYVFINDQAVIWTMGSAVECICDLENCDILELKTYLPEKCVLVNNITKNDRDRDFEIYLLLKQKYYDVIIYKYVGMNPRFNDGTSVFIRSVLTELKPIFYVVVHYDPYLTLLDMTDEQVNNFDINTYIKHDAYYEKERVHYEECLFDERFGCLFNFF